MKKENIRYSLYLILFLSLALRLWGIWNATSSDEYNEVFEALRVCSGHLNFERWGKRFYLYILSVEYGIYYVLGWIFQVFQSPMDFGTKIVRDPTPLFILARITSAIFGTASVFMTYVVGKTLFSRNVGIVAALFLCLNVVNIELSHYARVDATLCLVVLVAFYFVARIHISEHDSISKYYMLSGLFSGIAFQNKLPAVIIVIPFLFAHLSKYQKDNLLKGFLNKEVAYYASFFVAGLIIGNPAVLFAPVEFITNLMGAGRVYTTPLNETKCEHIGFVSYLIYFWREFGILLSILAGYSIFSAIFSKNKRNILLLSFILPFYLLMGASRYMVSYSYMIPLMPFLYLLMAKCLTDGLDNLAVKQKKLMLLASCLLLFLLAYPMYNVLKFEISLYGKNTRVLAKEWIEQNIPYGSKILMDSGKTINSFAPLIAANKESIQRTLERKTMEVKINTQNDTTQMVDANSLKYFEMLLKTVPHESYDITSTQFGLAVKPIDYYISNRFQYFIISEGMKKTRIAESFAIRHLEAAEFYKSLNTDRRIKLIKTINPTPLNRGQSFFIYKVAGE